MKNLVYIITAVFSLNFLSAQQINEDGLYINEKGELFNGVMFSHLADIRFKITIKEGKVSGEADYFYASGKIMETGIFKDGKKDDKWIRYNENGTIKETGFYSRGKKTGTWLVYDDRGKKRSEMNYQNGEKTGDVKKWDENGMAVNTKN